jgi:predicted secreted protein
MQRTRMRWAAAGGLLALLCLLSFVAAADEAPRFDVVNLQAERAQEVTNDLMRVVLTVREQDSDPAKLAERVNATMGWALEKSRVVKAVKVESGGYRTYPVYRDGVLDRWRAIQEVFLQSGDFKALGELVGTLQQRLQVHSLAFAVSDVRREEVENALIKEALDAFKTRADLVRTNLGRSGYRIVSLNIGATGGGAPPRPLMRTMAAESAAPAVEAGTTRLAVTVSGQIQLQ